MPLPTSPAHQAQWRCISCGSEFIGEAKVWPCGDLSGRERDEYCACGGARDLEGIAERN